MRHLVDKYHFSSTLPMRVGVRCKLLQALSEMVGLQPGQLTRLVVGSFISKARYKLETPLRTSELKVEDIYCTWLDVFVNFLVVALVQGKKFRQFRGSPPSTYT